MGLGLYGAHLCSPLGILWALNFNSSCCGSLQPGTGVSRQPLPKASLTHSGGPRGGARRWVSSTGSGKESCWQEVLSSSETPSRFELHPDQFITYPRIDFPCFTHLRPLQLSPRATFQNKLPVHKPQSPLLIFQESLRYDTDISLLGLPHKVSPAGGELNHRKLSSHSFGGWNPKI